MLLRLLERLVEALGVLYLGFLAIDSTYRLLMKTADLDGVLRSRNPGWRWLVIGAGVYFPLCCFVGGGTGGMGGVVAAETFGDYLVEATKLLLLSEAAKLAWCRWRGNWVGAGRVLRVDNGVVTVRTKKPAPAPAPPLRPQSKKVEGVVGEKVEEWSMGEEKAEGKKGGEDKVDRMVRVETEEAVELRRLRGQRIWALELKKVANNPQDRAVSSLLDA